MGPVGDVFDSCIVIDALNEVEAARRIIESSSSPAISIVTWIEVMAGAGPNDSIERALLSRFIMLPITPLVAERTAQLRRTSRLKLPDAIIYATAQVAWRRLVTRNTKDFDAVPDVLIPYRL